MKNLKKETLEVLKNRNKKWDDVIFIQTRNFRISNSKDEFLEMMDFEYDEGYGCIEIPEDLIIAGKDWWLERHDYDGSEWWEYKHQPEKLNEKVEIKNFGELQ